jgi:hypothetical protein
MLAVMLVPIKIMMMSDIGCNDESDLGKHGPLRVTCLHCHARQARVHFYDVAEVIQGERGGIIQFQQKSDPG